MSRLWTALTRAQWPVTVQRRVILEAVLARVDHPTAEQMYADVKARLPGLSRTTVYRARRISDDHRVILKVANPSHAPLDESLARLRRELEIVDAVRSERVVRAHEVAAVGGSALLIVQDLGGESLDRYLARARFALADVLGIAIGAAAALRDVHAAGIIHRDVTPNNIVFNATTGEIRLIDFDIATLDGSATRRHNSSTSQISLTGINKLPRAAASCSRSMKACWSPGLLSNNSIVKTKLRSAGESSRIAS